MTVADPEVVTGFEHGAIVGVGGSSLNWYEQLIGDASIQGAIKRTGSYALKMKPTGAQAARVELRHGTLIGISVRQYIYFVTLPSVNTMLTSEANTTFHTGIAFNAATGKLRSQSGSGPSYSADGPSVTTGVWYRLDFKVTLDTVPTPDNHTIEWKVDGTDYETLVVGATTAGYVSINWGASATLVAAEYYIDDVVVADSGFPIGAGKVVLLKVNGEGTHSTPGSLTDDAANSPPVDPQTRVDDVPITTAAGTDYVKQTTANSAHYIQLTLEDLPADAGEIQGVWVAGGGAAESAASGSTRVIFEDNDGTLTTIFLSTATTVITGVGDGIGRSPWWTKEMLADCKIRIGASTDVTPNCRVHWAFVEVGYALAEVAAAGGPELDLDPRKIEFTELPYQLHQAMLRMGRGSDEAR